MNYWRLGLLKAIFLTLLFSQSVFCQTKVRLKNLDFFKLTKSNWSIVGGVLADSSKSNDMSTEVGKGVLVCIHPIGKYSMDYDIFSKKQYGDLVFECDFVLAKASNSGIYFQSRYEVQLYDSWGITKPKYIDCGGIYERWGEDRPKGTKGYEGVAPKTNACKPAGNWQHIKISFQAPRFDQNGKKIANAKFLYVILNGILVQENVEVTGPTRGGLEDAEVALAPLRIQGDHGSVAFRNMRIKPL